MFVTCYVLRHFFPATLRQAAITAFITSSALLVAGCGGSNNDIEFKSFSLNKTTLDNPGSKDTINFEAQWAVYTGDFGSYRIRAYLVPASATTPDLNDSTRFLDRTCTNPGPVGRCGDPETEDCTYRRSSDDHNERALSCGISSITKPPGSYKVVAQMCTFDSDFDKNCSTQETALELK